MVLAGNHERLAFTDSSGETHPARQRVRTVIDTPLFWGRSVDVLYEEALRFTIWMVYRVRKSAASP